MPIYEYECQSCGSRIEVLQRIDDPPPASCNQCDEGELKKLVSAPAFQFKGDGWYVTDYARKDNGKDKGKDKGGDTKSGGQKEAKGSQSKDSGSKESKSTPTSSSEKKTSQSASK